MATITVRKKHPRVTRRKEIKSQNEELKALCTLFEKVSANSDSAYFRKIAQRLKMSRSNRPPMKVSKVVSLLNGEKCVAIVGKLLDDEDVLELPALKVYALQASRTVREKIEKFGGQVLTLDQIFKEATVPTLLRGKRTSRKCYKYFGAAGEKYSKTYPRTSNTGKNGERRGNRR